MLFLTTTATCDTAVLNETLNFVKQIIQLIFPSIFALLMFWISSKREDRIKEKDILNNRLNEFYIKFYKDFIRTNLPSDFKHCYPFTIDNLRVVKETLDYYIDSVQYLSHDSQQRLFNCYKSLAICAIDNSEFSLKQMNDDYTEFTHSLLLEYRGICRKLKLEEPVI